MAWAFALVLLAAVIRAFLPLVAPQYTALSWQGSALIWTVAFGCFLVRYLPILSSPRVDGKPG
jgi:uncharacterized protein involved in response to NO